MYKNRSELEYTVLYKMTFDCLCSGSDQIFLNAVNFHLVCLDFSPYCLVWHFVLDNINLKSIILLSPFLIFHALYVCIESAS